MLHIIQDASTLQVCLSIAPAADGAKYASLRLDMVYLRFLANEHAANEAGDANKMLAHRQ